MSLNITFKADPKMIQGKGTLPNVQMLEKLLFKIKELIDDLHMQYIQIHPV